MKTAPSASGWNNAFNLDVQGDNYPDKNEGTGGSYLDYCFVDKEVTTLKLPTVKILQNGFLKKEVQTSA